MLPYLHAELTREEKRIIKARESANEELRATLNNILTPVVALLDEYAHDRLPDFEDMACRVLQETRSRLDELVGPETLRTGQAPVPRARDTIPCAMEFND